MSDLTLYCDMCKVIYLEEDMNWHCENPICPNCKKKIQKYLKNQKEILVKKVIKNNLTSGKVQLPKKWIGKIVEIKIKR